MSLDKKFVEQNYKKGRGSVYLGVTLDDMTKEELIACLYASWEGRKFESMEHSRQLDIMAGR